MSESYYPNNFLRQQYDPIAKQTDGSYGDYMRIKSFEDVGYFLTAYVVDGGAVTQNATYNNRVDVTDVVVSLNDDIMTRDAASFTTVTPNTTYSLAFTKEGNWAWDIQPPPGVLDTDYLLLASVSTDGLGNVSGIVDLRGTVGGFRLKDEYGLGDYLKLDGSRPMTGTLNMGAFKIANVGTPLTTGDAANKGYVDVNIGGAIDDTKQYTDNAIKKALEYRVTEYGAKGDGVTDDAAAIQATVDAARLTGGTVYYPRGKYRINTTINVDLSNNTFGSGLGMNIEGDNPADVVLLNATGDGYLFNVHNDDFATTATAQSFRMSRLSLTIFDSNSVASSGVRLSGFANGKLNDLHIKAFDTGVWMADIVSMGMYDLRIDQNLRGLTAAGQIGLTTPNAIDLHSCTFYGNAIYGAYFNEGCNVNFIGGSVETNGHLATSENRYGVKLDGFGRYGSAGATFIGTYFEGNQTIADVWINHKNTPATYSFLGCTFNRFADPANSQHHIRMDTDGTLSNTVSPKVLVQGCGFRMFSGYVPDASRRVIQFYGATPAVLEQSGNYYNNQVDLPGPDTNRVFAHGRFQSLGSTPGLFRGFNVAGITKAATGDYTISFQFPSVLTEKIYTFSMSEVGFVRTVSETITSVRVQCFGPGGTAPLDPSALHFIACE